jgi:hypothetical protein
MCRRVLLAPALLLACAALSGCSLGSTRTVATIPHMRPRHSVRVDRGSARSYPPGALAIPLTVVCWGGLKQVVRTPLRRGKTALFGDPFGGDSGSLRLAVGIRGGVRATCD